MQRSRAVIKQATDRKEQEQERKRETKGCRLVIIVSAEPLSAVERICKEKSVRELSVWVWVVVLLIVHFKRVRRIAKSDSQLRHVCLSAWNSSAPTGRIFMKFGIWVIIISIQPLGRVSRNQSPVRRPVWLWHTASWASSQGQVAITFPQLQTFPPSPLGAFTSNDARDLQQRRNVLTDLAQNPNSM